jgi:hypothetical protein
VIATGVLLDWDLASRTHNCAALEFSQTCYLLLTLHFSLVCFLFETHPRLVISASQVLVEWNVVDSADAEAASYTPKDVGFDPIVMYLSRRTALCHTVAEVRVNA